jgi:hypothetical protein
MEITMSKPVSYDPSRMSKLPVYPFTVHWTGLDGLGREGELTAAYFQESGQYTFFKDVDHSVVEAFKTDRVTRIVRAERPVVG